MTTDNAAGDGTDDPGECDFCRYDITLDPVIAEHEGRTYEFCSTACRDRLTDGNYVFAEFHGARLTAMGISGIDAQLPQGLPRNSFVLLSGLDGTRQEAILVEAVWRTLQRGEPVVAVMYTEPPGAFIQHFLRLNWNVIPYLEKGQLRLIDAFTYRMADRDRMLDRMNRWSRHLYQAARDVTETVRDAGDMAELSNTIDGCLEAAEMSDRGIVTIDSLTELGTLVQPVQAYDFVKDLRADVCKGRFVPVIAGGTITGDESTFPQDLGYALDGIIQLQLSDDIVEDTLIKRVRIRKLNGVLTIPKWTAYEYTSGLGMVTFDPREQLEKAQEQREPSSESTEDDTASQPAAGESAKSNASEHPTTVGDDQRQLQNIGTDQADSTAAEDEESTDESET